VRTRHVALSLLVVAAISVALLVLPIDGASRPGAPSSPSGARAPRSVPSPTAAPDVELQSPRTPAGGAEVRREAAPDGERIAVEGSLTIHGPVAPANSARVELDWSRDGGGSLFSTAVDLVGARASWSAAFDGPGFELVAARVGGTDLTVLGSPTVGAGTERLDLELVVPGYSVIDVRDGSAAGPRIPTVSVAPLSVADTASVPITRGRANMLRESSGPREATQARLGFVDASELSVPIVVPTAGLAPRFALSAPGWRATEVDGREGGPWRIVVLRREHQLDVGFFGLPDVRTSVDVSVVVDGEVLAEEWVQTPEPATLGFERPDDGIVTLQVAGRGTVGGRRRLYEAEIELADGPRSRIDVDLGADSPTWASNAQTFVATVEVSEPTVDINAWAIRMYPRRSGDLGEGPAARELIEALASNLRDWDHVPGSTVYSEVLVDVAHGEYLLALEPHGLVTPVTIDETTSELRLAPPALATVAIWPIGAEGNALGDPGRLGMLRCEVVSAAGVDGGWSGAAAPRSINLARAVEGHWEVKAPAGATIEVEFLGPSAFGAEALRVVVEGEGPEATMQFSGL